ncbi:MAG: YraN family protein [Calditrichota bacterium]
MTKHNRNVGSWGESVAADYLEEQGYNILLRNHKIGRGEIDLIVLKVNVLVFVEVKSGRSSLMGLPEDRVTRYKQRQLYRLAQAFIQGWQGEADEFRMDVIAVDSKGSGYQVRHYENAFYI